MKVLQTLSAALDVLKAAKPNQLVAIDFYADWCYPCKMVSPFFEKLSEKYPQSLFFKINTDENRDAVMHFRIEAMPTFLFFKNEKQIGMIRGADPNGLEKFVKEHSADAVAAPTLAHSIHEMKEYLDSKKVDYSDCVEKKDLHERYLSTFDVNDLRAVLNEKKVDTTHCFTRGDLEEKVKSLL